MHRTEDEVDAIVYSRPNNNHMIQYRQMQPTQRYIKTRMQHQNDINRSSSTSRTVDVSYEDVMSFIRSSDNYEYVLKLPIYVKNE